MCAPRYQSCSDEKSIWQFQEIHFSILDKYILVLTNTYYNFWKGQQVMCAPTYQSRSDEKSIWQFQEIHLF